MVLDPDNQFNVERTLTKDDVQKLIKTCVDRLLMSASPSLDTIKMQVTRCSSCAFRIYFLNHFLIFVKF